MIGAATLTGGVVGLVAGLAARLAMRLLAALNPSTEGLLVAAMFPVGSFSFQGTFVILFQAVIIGAMLIAPLMSVRNPHQTRGDIDDFISPIVH